MTLNMLPEGKTARIKELHNSGSMRQRLLDLGLIEGTKVKCLQKSPFGDPIAYCVRGAVIALRTEDSSKIIIEE